MGHTLNAPHPVTEAMTHRRSRLVDAPALVALLGLVFVVVGVSLWLTSLAPRATSPSDALFSLVMHVLFGGVILVLGIHVERSELPSEERFAVLIWCYGGFSLMFVLMVWGHLGEIADGMLTLSFVSDFVVFTSLGGAFGVIAGVNWGRATRNRLLAERNEDQRETLALLTRLLSHDIRNDLTVVKGYADLLTDHVDAEGHDHVEIIRERMTEIESLLETTSTLVKSFDEERDFDEVDLSSVLRTEVRTLKVDNPAITIEVDIPSGLVVKADSLVDQLFTNLLQNAVNHNEVDDLTVRVTAERVDDEVLVTVDDNGRGLPPEIRESCFDLGEQGPDSDGDGIGLYLVSRLAVVYDGSVTVDESPTGGARFQVSLPAAQP